jgi:hypothetical protein
MGCTSGRWRSRTIITPLPPLPTKPRPTLITPGKIAMPVSAGQEHATSLVPAGPACSWSLSADLGGREDRAVLFLPARAAVETLRSVIRRIDRRRNDMGQSLKSEVQLDPAQRRGSLTT